MSEFHAVAEQILITSDAGGVGWIPQDSEWAACCPMASHGSGRSRWLDCISCARSPLREDDLQQRRGLSFSIPALLDWLKMTSASPLRWRLLPFPVQNALRVVWDE